jgi:phosphoesterase RecJ-like protein
LDVYKLLQHSNSILVSGHVRPDGDCIGSCLATYTIIKERYPEKRVEIYLEPILDSMKSLKNANEIIDDIDLNFQWDLFISLDCGDIERLGKLAPVYKKARHTLNIDHHISNNNFGEYNVVELNASSTCEIVYDLFGDENISLEVAEMLYIGILHDTGNLRHSSTTPKTLITVAKIFAKGIKFSQIIDEMFLTKTFEQTKLIGIALNKAKRVLDDKVIYSEITTNDLKEAFASVKDTGVIIDNLRVVKGIEVAIFIYELPDGEKKVSLRSNELVDVCSICQQFGGGGHVRASGCTLSGTAEEIVDKLVPLIKAQL